MKIGVIGVGIIASYIVEGLCEKTKDEHKIILSPRNREKVLALKAKYENQIEIAMTNQDVVDKSEVIILSVLPQKAQEILSSIQFKETNKVISVIPILGLDAIREIIGNTQILVDFLPLPFISKGIGPMVLYPNNKEIAELLRPLGDLVCVESEKEMSVLRSTTALMSPFYQLVNHVVEWCKTQGMNEKDAKEYVTSFFSALSVLAGETSDGKLEHLANEMTPGGLNFQAVSYLKSENAFNLWQIALDGILKRVEGC